MTTPTPAALKLTRAKVRLLTTVSPFYGTVIMRLKFIATASIQTAATNGRDFLYNPAFIDSLQDDEVMFVVAHEAGHVANNHPHRMTPKHDAKLANQAMDFVVNGQLAATVEPTTKRPAFQLVKGALVNPAYDGLSWERVYAILDAQRQGGGNGQKPPEQPKPQQSSQKPGQPNAGNAPPSAQQAPGKATTPTPPQSPATQPGNPQAGQSSPGQGTPGAGGQDVQPYPADSPAELAEAEALNTQATFQAAQAARGCGKLPGHIERMIDDMKAPAVDWRNALRQFLTRSRDSHTWKTPRRRALSAGMYLPARSGEQCGPLVVFRDTSGSTAAFWDQFHSELAAIVADVRPRKITIVDINTRVRQVLEFTPDDFPASLPMKGGGGTRFQPAIDWLDEQDEQPAAAVYLTDLEATHPTDAPACPFLWVSTNPRAPSPPFGDRIDLAPQ